MAVIYLDTLFLVNAAVDYVLLLAAAKVCAKPFVRWRLALAAALGAGYSCCAVFPELGFFTCGWFKALFGGLMVLAAFGGRGFIKSALTFFAVSALFSGGVMALTLLGGQQVTQLLYRPVTLRLLAAAFGIMWAVVSLVLRRKGGGSGGGEIVTAQVTLGGRTVSFPALCDTGNNLCDPVTGQAVLIADVQALLPLFDGAAASLLQKTAGSAPDLVQTLAAAGFGGMFRLVPYRTLGTDAGLIAAFRPEKVALQGKKQPGMLVAVAPAPVSDGGAYLAVAPGM